jgi:hypothetical protein
MLGCAVASGGDPAAVELAPAASTLTAFQDGSAPTSAYAGTTDTMLEQDHATTNHGSDKKLSVSGDTPSDSGEDEVALVRWELGTAIPAGAVIASATVILSVSDKADQTYQVFEAGKAWDEATATWKRASSSVNWDASGAAGAGDRGTAVLGTIDAASTGTFKIAFTAAGIAAVQRWINDPTTNHGIVIANADNDNRLEFHSREDSKSSRPRLEITWALSGTTPPPTSGVYTQTCDGSAAIALDATHFLDFDDEDQVARIYTRNSHAGPVQTVDVSAAIGMKTSDEADLEDAARIGNRVYVTGSHGRNKDGKLEPTRDRLFAIDLSGAVPAVKLTVAGWTDQLVVDLLDAANWDQPDQAVIAQLAAATQLTKSTVASLAPEASGLNIEGLAAYPSASAPNRLILGLRNPHAANQAILITLLNADAAITGAPAHFGQVIELDLGGLGVRGLTWSDALGAMLVIGGPVADDGAIELFTWSGDPASAPVVVQALSSPSLTAAEAVVAYPGPGTTDVQVLFDAGGQLTNGTACKDLSASAQAFTDQTIHLP